MFQCFYPSKMEESSYVIPYENWKKMGIQGIVYDIDNTLVPHGAPADERAIRLFEHLRGLGLKTCLLSNNKEPRVKSFAQQVKCPYIYKGGKPGAKGYKKAMETMGTDVKNTLFVGDQLFTDIWGANRLNLSVVQWCRTAGRTIFRAGYYYKIQHPQMVPEHHDAYRPVHAFYHP